MAANSFPLNIYKVELLKLSVSDNDHSSEYLITEDYGNYKRGDIVVVDEDNTVLRIDRGRGAKLVKTPTSTPTYGPKIQHKEYNLTKHSNLKVLLSNKNTTVEKSTNNSNKYNSKTLSETLSKTLPTVKTNKYTKRKLRPLIIRKSKRPVSTNYSTPKNDLEFINQYVLAYQNREQDPKRYNAFNRALSKNPNKSTMWHGIWSGIDPSHTLELSDALHEMLYTIHPGTKNEMGQMNWYNIFNGNLLHATAPNSLDYVSPEWRAKTIQMTTPTLSSQVSNEGIRSIDNSNTIDDIISQNLDLFRSQYEYAKLHNAAFNYLPSAFDTTNLNVNYKYGGIGDFMDTYGISPLYLYDKLKTIYE